MVSVGVAVAMGDVLLGVGVAVGAAAVGDSVCAAVSLGVARCVGVTGRVPSSSPPQAMVSVTSEARRTEAGTRMWVSIESMRGGIPAGRESKGRRFPTSRTTCSRILK
jgi:hypothetical protein